MARDRICIYGGHEFYIVGEAERISLVEEKEVFVELFFALNRIECVKVRHIQSAMWIPSRLVYLKPSVHDYSLTEWYLAVADGD